MNLDGLNRTITNLDFSDSEINSKKEKERKQINFNCPVCKKRLTSSYGARMHIRIIHGIEHYLFCPHQDCTFAAGQSMDLARHLITTHGLPASRRNLHLYKCMYSG